MQLRTLVVTAVTVATLIAPTSTAFSQENPTTTTPATPTTTSAPTTPLTRAEIAEIRRLAMQIRTAAKEKARATLDAKVSAAAKVQKAALKQAASIKNKEKRLSRIAEIRMAHYNTTSTARGEYFAAVEQARKSYEASIAITKP